MYRSFTHACTILVASGPPLEVPSPYRCIGLKEQEHLCAPHFFFCTGGELWYVFGSASKLSYVALIQSTTSHSNFSTGISHYSRVQRSQ